MSMKRNCRKCQYAIRSNSSNREPHLKVAKVGGGSVEKADRRELDGGIQAHVLEAAEARHQCRTTLPVTTSALAQGEGNAPNLPNDFWDASDVKNATGEGGGHGRLSLGKRDSHVGSLQCATIVCAITTEPAAVIDTLQFLHELMLLVRRHARIHLSTCEHLLCVSCA